MDQKDEYIATCLFAVNVFIQSYYTVEQLQHWSAQAKDMIQPTSITLDDDESMLASQNSQDAVSENGRIALKNIAYIRPTRDDKVTSPPPPSVVIELHSKVRSAPLNIVYRPGPGGIISLIELGRYCNSSSVCITHTLQHVEKFLSERMKIIWACLTVKRSVTIHQVVVRCLCLL